MEKLSPKVQRLVKVGEPLVGLAALATIPLLAFGEQLSSGVSLLASSLIWSVFAGNFLIILLACQSKAERRFWWRKSALDILIIVASFPLLPDTLQSLRVLKSGRILKLVHFSRAGRFLTLTLLLRWLKRRFSLNPIVFSGSTAVVAMLIGANAIHLLEPQTAPDLESAMWFAFTTCSTVGYGDIIPTTGPGRLVGVLLMIVGVACMAAFSGALASYLVTTQEAEEHAATAAIMKELQEIREQLSRLEDGS